MSLKAIFMAFQRGVDIKLIYKSPILKWITPDFPKKEHYIIFKMLALSSSFTRKKNAWDEILWNVPDGKHNGEKKKKAKRYDLCFNVPIQTESDRFMGWEENADGFFTYCKSKKKNF